MSTKRVATDITLRRIATSLEDVSSLLDGTEATYKNVMRRWFLSNGAANATAKELTLLCDEWYGLTRDTWNGYTTFYQPDISAVTTGTKGGDNETLTCTPSTDSESGQDDYAGLPLFACIDCNWEMYTDDDGNIEPLITAIEGITDNFERSNPDKYVGVLQMSGWHWWVETDETYTHGYSATRMIHVANIEPLAESIRQDGTIREWVIHAKYMSHLTDDLLFTSCSGLVPTCYNISHNTTHTYVKNNGSMYSGATTADDTFAKLMVYIKYGSLTLDGIMAGCNSYNKQYPAQIAEEGVKRIIVESGASSYIEVGCTILIGDYATSLDRSTATIYATSGKHGAIVTKLEDYTDDDENTYLAVYVDTDDTFDTGANGDSTEGTTYISTFHWRTGTTDSVLGNDGSPTSNTSGKYPFKLQGIEMMLGCYEILADVILRLYVDDDEVYYYEPYICKTSGNQSTSITDDYEVTGYTIEQPDSAAWLYIKKLSMSGGVMFPIEVNGSSSTYTRDAFYMIASITRTIEWLSRGALHYGPYAGLSCLLGGDGLSVAHWYYASRLSPNGNRGEFAA